MEPIGGFIPAPQPIDRSPRRSQVTFPLVLDGQSESQVHRSILSQSPAIG